MTNEPADPQVAALAALFAASPAWEAAAGYVSGAASSGVWFSHRPGDPWRLVRRDGVTVLEPGRADEPDFAFRFTPSAIVRLAACRGGIAGVAVTLFELILDADSEDGIGFRICAPFPRLLAHGYLRLLLAAGPEVLRFGLTHGVTTVRALRRMVEEWRKRAPEPWEADHGPGNPMA